MRYGAVLLTSALAVSGCQGAGDDGDIRTTVPTAPPTSTTTQVSYKVPATIDVPYIEKVMAALDHVDGEAARRAAAQRRLDEEFFEHYVAIYTDKYFSLVQRAWLEIAGNGFGLLADAPGDPRTVVERVLVAKPNCVLFQAKRDYSSQLNGPDADVEPRYVALVPLPAQRNVGGRNPTPWIMSMDGRNSDGSAPKADEVCAER